MLDKRLLIFQIAHCTEKIVKIYGVLEFRQPLASSSDGLLFSMLYGDEWKSEWFVFCFFVCFFAVRMNESNSLLVPSKRIYFRIAYFHFNTLIHHREGALSTQKTLSHSTTECCYTYETCYDTPHNEANDENRESYLGIHWLNYCRYSFLFVVSSERFSETVFFVYLQLTTLCPQYER